MPTTRNQKRHRIYMRILLLVDLLASSRSGMRIGDICRGINQRSGEHYCERTIRRDLSAMEEIGFVRTLRKPVDDCKFPVTVWVLNLGPSTPIQTVAYKALEA